MSDTFHPGFDPSSMSDEELFEKQAELGRRLSWAARFSSNGEAVDQLMRMAQAIDATRRERAYLASYAFQESLLPGVTETDPDLRAAQKGAAQTETAGNKPTAIARPRPFALKARRSDVPVATLKPTVSPVEDTAETKDAKGEGQ